MKQPMARVVSHEQIAHGIYELTLFTPIADSAEPGQFVHVKIPGGGAHMLRRPISIARSEESTLTLIYQIKGAGTRLLSHVGAGEFIDVLGPLGNGFSVKNVNRALVVGGGMVGCEAAEYLAERGHQVAIVEMKDVIAADVTPENRRYMFRNFEEDHVLLQPGAKAPGNAVLATGDALEAALAI